MATGAKLRELMAKGTVVAPFVYDGFMARMATTVGFDAIYHSGFGNSASWGFPDVGLLTLSEMTDKIRILSASTDLPIISDADTGYGSYANVIRTVKEYERAGAGALHIEDQVWPKSCGFLGNKRVIDKKEAVSKIKAAVDARTSDKDLIIIARTDALTVNGWEDVEERVNSFMEAGADMVFVDGIRTLEIMMEYYKRLSRFPLLLNDASLFPLKEIEAIGSFSLIIHPGMINHCWNEMEKDLRALKDEGISLCKENSLLLLKHVANIMGAEEYLKLDEHYKNL